ncbi:hypothetical protein [Phenylobacterium sp.]|uniref:hypothetical protein n=1 Tax=Phenylobacterium sp. TaxID=1871053 RepID=UPI00272F83FB|nr:hypothetical protein [Phenylobacterium sp.]MDP2212279.1 hypothetical protein [Phenylobacterium sp.]
MSDWERVEGEVAAIVSARPDEYDAVTRENLAELLRLIKETRRPAPFLAPGYWPTFRIVWEVKGSENLEIEVFDDRYEVYRSFDGRTDIWYEHHRPGEPLSAPFLSELPDPT